MVPDNVLNWDFFLFGMKPNNKYCIGLHHVKYFRFSFQTQFTMALSQSIRTERHKQKRKSMPVTFSQPSRKRFALGI